VMLAGGLVVGTWRGRRRADTLEIAIEPFEDIEREMQAGRERECADLARFLAADLTPPAAE